MGRLFGFFNCWNCLFIGIIIGVFLTVGLSLFVFRITENMPSIFAPKPQTKIVEVLRDQARLTEKTIYAGHRAS